MPKVKYCETEQTNSQTGAGQGGNTPGGELEESMTPTRSNGHRQHILTDREMYEWAKEWYR